jgi:hypothetical protein
MNRVIRKACLSLGAALIVCGLVIAPAAAATSASLSTSTNASASSGSGDSVANQTRIELIISRGDGEINRRLVTLKTLDTKINSAAKLSASDKVSLTTEVNNEISGLSSLETTLDQATTVSAAVADGQSIITDYRVYLLVVPQVNLVKTADDQQLAEAKLMTLAAALTTRLSGSTNTALVADLSDMKAQISAGQGLSASVETTILGLTPTGYSSGELTTYRNQLSTAQTDNKAALKDGQAIVSELVS